MLEGGGGNKIYTLLFVNHLEKKLSYRAVEAALTSFLGCGILGDCVTSTLPNRLYLFPTTDKFPPYLGRLRDTVKTLEKFLEFTKIRNRHLRPDSLYTNS